jgi:hypothetical protein
VCVCARLKRYYIQTLLCKVVVVVVVVDMESENRDVGPKTREKREREQRERNLSRNIYVFRLSAFFSLFFLMDLFFADFSGTNKKREIKKRKKRIGRITRRRRLVTKPRALFAKKKKKNRRGEKKKTHEKEGSLFLNAPRRESEPFLKEKKRII